MKEQRNWELDKCRVVACLMVVLLHVASTGWFIDPTTSEWRIFNLTDTMVRGSVPLFFMISGTLFFTKERLDLGRFIKKNVAHLVFLYVVWSLIYEISSCLINGQFDLNRFLTGVCKGHYHLWFLPAMILSYLFLPVIHHALKGYAIKPGYLLFLFGFVTLLVVNVNLIPSLPESISLLLDKANLSNAQYVGYMIWGYFLSRKHWGKKTRLITVLIYLAAGLATASANRWFSISHGQAVSWLYGYFTLPSFLQATAIFCFFQTFRNNPELPEGAAEEEHPRLWNELSSCTLGVYLIHPMVLETLTQIGFRVTEDNPVYKIPAVFSVTVVICFLLIFLVRRIAYIKKLV